MTKYEYAVESYLASGDNIEFSGPMELDEAREELDIMLKTEETFRKLNPSATGLEYRIVRRQIVEWEPHDAD